MSALIQHSTLPDAQKHEPKGVEAASPGDVYIADGAGGGSFGPQAGGGVTAHGGLTGLANDDHPQYLSTARHGAISGNPHGTTAAQVGADSAGTAANLMATHEGAADPHAGYVQEALLSSLISEYLDRQNFVNAVPQQNQTIAFVDYMNETPTLGHLATYKVSVHYVWSLNDGAQDFIAQLLFDGVGVNVEPHRQEPKDVAGAGPFGTDQRHLAVITGFVSATPGAHNIQLQFRCGALNDQAAIYEARIYIERWA